MSLQHIRKVSPPGADPGRNNESLNVPPRLVIQQRAMRRARYTQAVASGVIPTKQVVDDPNWWGDGAG